ncbi:MAG: serine hydrolase domain-containing protein [Nocardioides sp.]
MESTDLFRAARRALRGAPWGAAIVTVADEPSGTGPVMTSTAHELPEQGHVELGSVSKAVTGLLLHDAVDRGVLSTGDRLADHLPLDGCAAGEVTLASLAVHASGLPRLPRVEDVLGRTWRMLRRGENPYGDTVQELLEQTRRTAVGRPRPAYSNLGFELLGHAVAAAQGTTYAALVRDRIAGPLGLDSWHVPADPAEVRPGAIAGRSRRGRPHEPWTGEGLGPAGGLRSTLGDAARWVTALLEGRVPGAGALDPVARLAGPVRIGAGWMVTPVPDGEITWHNGMTGGHAAFVGLDRRRRSGVVVVRAVARPVDGVGMRLLRELGRSGSIA